MVAPSYLPLCLCEPKFEKGMGLLGGPPEGLDCRLGGWECSGTWGVKG